MNKKRGSATLILMVIVGMLLIPSLFNKSTTTPQEKTSNNKKTTTQETKANLPKEISTKTPEIKKEEDIQKITKKTEIKDPNKSPYEGKISISYVYGSSKLTKNEKIRLINNGEEPINITGFTIETYDKQTFKIPKGYELPGFGAMPENNIILKKGEIADIYVGTQERRMDFRENICTGYFDEKSDFGGALSHNCPKINASKMLNFSDKCINMLNNLPTCKIYQSKMDVEYSCDEFATTHYSYAGCVKDYKNNQNFYKNRWLIWMQKTYNFFRDERELVIVKDQDGKTITEYSY